MNIVPRRRAGELTNTPNDWMRSMRRFFDDDFALPPLFEGQQAMVAPPLNIGETDKQYSISVELPGMNEKDIEVQVLGDALVISGERKWEDEKKNKEYHRIESHYGRFERRVTLPANAKLDGDAVTASYKKGVLEVLVPKVEPTPLAKIPVKAS
jgi:HSP20 family protein